MEAESNFTIFRSVMIQADSDIRHLRQLMETLIYVKYQVSQLNVTDS